MLITAAYIAYAYFQAIFFIRCSDAKSNVFGEPLTIHTLILALFAPIVTLILIWAMCEMFTEWLIWLGRK